ncbi:C4BPA protein, partial [Formicarius rufipectus]|nr:C4BPA protein [Formicarius rufipectus]
AAWGRAEASPATVTSLPAGDCPAPPTFVFAELITTPEDSYPVGTQLRYQCRPGYVRNGDEPTLVTCLANSTWSEKPDFCIGKSCGQPTVMNGNFHTKTNLLLGATVTFTCNTGYLLLGPPSTQCIFKNGIAQWEKIPSCEIILCLPPPEIKNGQLIDGNQDFTFGRAASFSCDQGFTLIGQATIYCTMGPNNNGTWSSPAPECKEVKCENPDVKNGKKLSGFGPEYTYKDAVTFECNSGYRMNGSGIVTCEANSSWTPPLPTCDEILCGPPPRFPFAALPTAVGESSKVGTKLSYQCSPGYKAAPGKSSVLICQDNETWSAADPNFCVREYLCSSPVLTGLVNIFSFLRHTVIKSSAKCVASGSGVSWDPAPPYCSKKLSGVPSDEPPTIVNGMHSGAKGTGFVRDSGVACKSQDGFPFAGAAFLQCREGDQYQGVWNKPSPDCRGG